MVTRTRIAILKAVLNFAAFAAIVWSAPPSQVFAAAGTEKTPTALGIVSEYSASDHSFSIRDDQDKNWKFVWNHETKFNGVVSTGARVSVRYTPQADGANLAQTVGVLK